ncbi:MAG: radical SAM protein [Candidatus Woesearchaeota archaeon]|nr:radical SAM protein [Candidatus Woesearchaeota archaeon]
MKPIYFERAIFISWYCSKRDCAFCYLSSKPDVEQDPLKDRRSKDSIFAEAEICKACNWKVEFISGGCDTYTDDELLDIIKTISKITKQKQWLNLGILTEKQLKLFKPYIEGVCGTVECITPKLRDKLCPSKPLKEIEEMFQLCDKLNLKKAITLVLGLGETEKDIPLLNKFIKKYSVDRLTIYRLKPQKNTIFEKSEGPSTVYYTKWIKEIREEFPQLEIIAGSWLSHLTEINKLIKAGANAITKFPSIRLFNSDYAKTIEEECKKANKELISKLSGKVNIKTTNPALKKYLKRMNS